MTTRLLHYTGACSQLYWLAVNLGYSLGLFGRWHSHIQTTLATLHTLLQNNRIRVHITLGFIEMFNNFLKFQLCFCIVSAYFVPAPFVLVVLLLFTLFSLSICTLKTCSSKTKYVLFNFAIMSFVDNTWWECNFVLFYLKIFFKWRNLYTWCPETVEST